MKRRYKEIEPNDYFIDPDFVLKFFKENKITDEFLAPIGLELHSLKSSDYFYDDLIALTEFAIACEADNDYMRYVVSDNCWKWANSRSSDTFNELDSYLIDTHGIDPAEYSYSELVDLYLKDAQPIFSKLVNEALEAKKFLKAIDENSGICLEDLDDVRDNIWFMNYFSNTRNDKRLLRLLERQHDELVHSTDGWFDEDEEDY